ncbi:MAG: hypothetical protein AAFR61_21035 [Bacteroidota bacterium]
MTRPFSSILLSLGLSLVLIFKPLETSQACGWDPEDAYLGFSFFDPAIIDQPTFSPLFYSYDRWYDHSWQEPEGREQDVLGSWEGYFGPKVKRADIRRLLYSSNIEELKTIKDWVERQSKNLPDSLAENTLVQHWRKKKWSIPICYFMYTREVEPYVARRGDYWNEEPRDVSAMEELIADGLQKYEVIDDAFLKRRYAYQVVRLAHYAGMPADAVKLYDDLAGPLFDESAIAYWTMAQKAGALGKRGQHAQASYLFSRVFENNASQRMQSWQSFKVSTDQEWDAVMALCQNEEEKLTLHFMRAMDPTSFVLEEIKEMHRLSPGNPKLDMLLAREINKLEQELLTYHFKYEWPITIEREDHYAEAALKNLDLLSAWVGEHKGEMKSAALWEVADGYLSYMRGKFGAAKQALQTAKSLSTSEDMTQHITYMEWLLELSQVKKLGLRSEGNFYDRLQQMELGEDPHQLKERGERFLKEMYAHLFAKQGENGKAFLSTRSLYDLKTQPGMVRVKTMMAWIEDVQNREPTSFEREVLMEKLGDHPLSTLLEMKGTLELGRHQWDAAIATFEKIPAASVSKLDAFTLEIDPFIDQRWDCLECAEYEKMDKPTTKLELARKLKMLSETAASQVGMAAEASYSLGLATYNMSFFGTGWRAAAYTRSGSSWYDNIKEDPQAYLQEKYGIFLQLDMETPEKYFLQAAQQTEDEEFAARALFMAAKCEQNRYYMDGYKDDYPQSMNEKTAYRTHFKRLLDEYGETDFLKEAIRECGYLEMFEVLHD